MSFDFLGYEQKFDLTWVSLFLFPYHDKLKKQIYETNVTWLLLSMNRILVQNDLKEDAAPALAYVRGHLRALGASRTSPNF